MTELALEIVSSDRLSRVAQIGVDRPLRTPTYFPAVSGASMSARPIDLIKLVVDTRYPRVLVSAYDLHKLEGKQRTWAAQGLSRFRAAGGFVFLDCGVFESYWLRDDRWDFRHYERIVRAFERDFYASFDGVGRVSTTRALSIGFEPPAIRRSIRLAEDSLCALIAHAATPQRLVKAVTALAKHATAARRSVTRRSSLMVAVAERECGTSVVERAGTIAAIRVSLERVARPALLHILGCGYPTSMAAYASAGADTFDSRDWCEVAIDWRTFSTVDFSLLGPTGCPCKVCSKFRIDNLQKGLLHNLLFYQTFALRIQRMVQEGTLDDFLLEVLGERTIRQLKAATGKVHHSE